MRLAFLALALHACSSTATATCDNHDGMCVALDGLRANLLVEQGFCATFTWSGTCPAGASLVGTCTFDGDSVTTVTSYYSPDFTVEAAQTDCADVQVGSFATP